MNITTNKGPTVTMFVPYDCNNCCPFCVNKGDYRDTSGFDLQRCYKSLEIMDRIYPENDIVLTGGEPLADLDTLQDILDHIKDTHDLYINTTLPAKNDAELKAVADILNRNAKKITCVNVSRHLEKYVEECSDEIFDLLEPRHRINCVVFGEVDDRTKDKLEGFLERFAGHEIQLRANYSKLTLDNVFEIEDDALFKLISEITEYKGSLEKELFRTGFVFQHGDSKITYHKTLPYSKIDGHVGDIIIRQTGMIYDDWNDYGTPLDINKLVG